MTKRGVLPKGAGGVSCTECEARAAADGTGAPIVLKCEPWCEQGNPFRRVQRKVVELAIPKWEWQRDDVVAFSCDFTGNFYDDDRDLNCSQFVVHVRRATYLPKDGVVPYDPEGRRAMAPMGHKKATDFIERLLGIQ